jgi:hypothetical protein
MPHRLATGGGLTWICGSGLRSPRPNSRRVIRCNSLCSPTRFAVSLHESRYKLRMPVHRREPAAASSPLVRWLTVGVVAVSALVLASWLVIALAHVDDDYHVGWVTGSWMALAKYVNEGVLYPPLFNGHSFGGTRYMPLQFVTHAGLARVTDEYLVSSKLLGYASGALLYGLAFSVYRRISGSAWLAMGLVAAVLSSVTGLEAATTLRGDALPAAFQLGAVAVVARKSQSAAALAGALCALAFVSKLSAIWGAAAILIWLAIRDRPRLPIFAASLLGCGGVLLGIFEAASKGRMTANIFSLAGAGEQGNFSVLDFATKIVSASEGSGAMWILVPFAVASIGGAIAGRRLTIYHVAFLVASAVVISVMTDAGTVPNHFLDLQILAGVLIADVWRANPSTGSDVVRASVLAAILLGTLASYVTNVANDTETAARSLAGGDHAYEARPLTGVLEPDDRLLSEDPYVPVSRGEDPVVLDAFMLLRILNDHPDWEAVLVRQIKARTFTKILLVRKLDPSDPFWQSNDFGLPVISAIAQNYRLVNLPRYYQTPGHLAIYAPTPRPSASP